MRRSIGQILAIGSIQSLPEFRLQGHSVTFIYPPQTLLKITIDLLLPQSPLWPMLFHMPNNPPGTHVTERHASLFRNGRNQAVRIPREFEMEGTEVLMRKEGDHLILTPIRKNRLLDLLASWEPLDEGLPDVADTPPQIRDPL